MNPTKAKYLGIFYTFLLTAIQMALLFLLVFLLLSWLLGFNLLDEDMGEFVYSLFSLVDLAIPMIILSALFQVNKIGNYYIYGVGEHNGEHTLMSTAALSVAFMTIISIYYQEFVVSINGSLTFDFFVESLIYSFGAWCLSLLIFFPPSLLFNQLLRKILIRQKP